MRDGSGGNGWSFLVPFRQHHDSASDSRSKGPQCSHGTERQGVLIGSGWRERMRVWLIPQIFGFFPQGLYLSPDLCFFPPSSALFPRLVVFFPHTVVFSPQIASSSVNSYPIQMIYIFLDSWKSDLHSDALYLLICIDSCLKNTRYIIEGHFSW